MRILKLIIFLIVTFINVNAQEGYLVHEYSLEEGLATEINSIVQDKDGFIWVGGKGLYRYNGLKFTQFITDTVAFKGITTRVMLNLFVDSDSDLWLGNPDGLYLYDRKKVSFLHFLHHENDPSSLFNNLVNAIFEDKNKTLWVGNWKGLSKFDKKTKTFKNYDFGVPFIWSICQDRDGNLWIGTLGNGVIKFNPENEQWKIYVNDPKDKNSIGANRVKGVVCDNQGQIWLATWGGLNLYNPAQDNFSKYYYNGNLAKSDVLLKDRKGQIWIGSEDGLFILNPETKNVSTFYGYLKENNLPLDYIVLSLYQDQLGDIWVGTTSGLYQISENNFKNYKSDFLSKAPSRICPTKEKNFLLSNDDGINLFDRKNNSISHLSSDLLIFMDKMHRYWKIHNQELVVTQPYSLNTVERKYILNPKDSISGLLSLSIKTVIVDNSGNFWIRYENMNKIGIIDSKTLVLKNTSYRDVLPIDWEKNKENFLFMRLGFDADSNLWISAWLNLFKVNTKTKKVVRYHSYQNGLSSPHFGKIVVDSKKNTWFLTAGIEMYDKVKDKFIVYDPSKGLANSNTNDVFEDHNGNFWISTPFGISCLDPTTKKVRNFSKNDGLGTNRYYQISGITEDNGDETIIAGGNKCVTLFKPDKLKKNLTKVPVIITNFRLFNKDVMPGPHSPLKESIETASEIVLRHNQNVISFEFIALNYRNVQRNSYAYKMEGFEKEFNYVGSNKVANYTNLEPGEYYFHVIAANNDGIWNREGKRIKVIVLPPFWKTIWFRLLSILALAGLITGFFRLRLRTIRNQKRNLEVQVEERTAEIVSQKEEIQVQAEELSKLNSTKDKFFSIIGHDLKNPIFAINGLASLLRERNSEMLSDQRAELIAMIESSSKNVSSLLENLLTWARSQSSKITPEPESFRVAAIVTECLNLLQASAEKKNITLVNEMTNDIIAFADRNMITTVIRNLVSNALKFTGDGGEVTISGAAHSDSCSIKISDTGVGMDDLTKNKLFRIDEHVTNKGTSGEDGTGLGLIICKEFIDKNNGKILVESEVGKGSVFTILLPAGTKTDVAVTSEEKKEGHHAEHSPASQTEIQSDLDKFEENSLKKFLKSLKREKYTILVIEDDDRIRISIKESLNQYFTVEEADNGKSGIALAKEKVPDLIISDVMMPHIDGFELCAKLKADIRTSHIPIILLTARDAEKSRITGINLGADDYIIKPFKQTLLLARIKNLIQQREQLIEKFSQEFILEPTNTQINNKENDFLKKAIALIEMNMENPQYSVEEFSAGLGMSYMQVYRKMDAMVGQAPVQFIRSIRLKKAAHLLENTDKPINEIALSVGFNDPSYFTKCFQEQFGILPKKYINMKKRSK